MEQKESDHEFYKSVSILFLGIVFMLILVGYLSNVFASYSQSHIKNHGKEMSKLIDKRTQPLGKINLTSNPTAKTAITLVSDNTKNQSGEQVYNTICAACHTSGVAEAPITGNKEQWRNRISEGIEHLYEQAINGVGIMPAKGGMATLSDEEVKAAVDFIIERSN